MIMTINNLFIKLSSTEPAENVDKDKSFVQVYGLYCPSLTFMPVGKGELGETDTTRPYKADDFNHAEESEALALI